MATENSIEHLKTSYILILKIPFSEYGLQNSGILNETKVLNNGKHHNNHANKNVQKEREANA